MIKPDYISFSQEAFDECEDLRAKLLENREFAKTAEYRTQAIKLAEFILGNEYGQYLREIQSK